MLRKIIGIVCLSSLHWGWAQSNFVTIENQQFVRNQKPYHYIGSNYWYGGLLGTTPENQQRLRQELDELKRMGVTNLRVMVGAEGGDQDYTVTPALQPQKGKYNTQLWSSLDYLLAEMEKRNMTAILFLTNNWEWSGGLAKYLEWNGYGAVPNPNIPPHTWPEFMSFTQQFHQCQPCQDDLLQHVRIVMQRTNSITNRKYTEDPTIMAWEVANEPRVFSPQNETAFTTWLQKLLEEMNRLAPNQLITTGSEGMAGSNDDLATFERTHNNPLIDYLTIHIWPKNWGWYQLNDEANSTQVAISKTLQYIDQHLEVAQRLQKPLVLEEFGFPRSGEGLDTAASTQYRDQYYEAVFKRLQEAVKNNEPFVALNFWGYGGLAKQHPERGKWNAGDDFTTDPPQEPQGLNSVFSNEKKTLRLIKKFALQFQ